MSVREVSKKNENEDLCDNCLTRVLFGEQIKVETVDGVRFMCRECAEDFKDEE